MQCLIPRAAPVQSPLGAQGWMETTCRQVRGVHSQGVRLGIPAPAMLSPSARRLLSSSVVLCFSSSYKRICIVYLAVARGHSLYSLCLGSYYTFQSLFIPWVLIFPPAPMFYALVMPPFLLINFSHYLARPCCPLLFNLLFTSHHNPWASL